MSRQKTVYIVRHGQSVDNALPVFQSYDSPLSEKGLQQAEKIAQRALKLKFDALISSPQKRALQTAQAVAEKTSSNLETSELFIERFKPTFIDGKAWEDEAANKIWREWEESLITPGLKIQNGENYDEIIQRADTALKSLENRPEDNILVVSHGHFIRTLIARILLGQEISPGTLSNFYQLTYLENTAITVIIFTDAYEENFRWRLWTLNDHTHFAE